jgi:predicted SAM-dependent methyltransferase
LDHVLDELLRYVALHVFLLGEIKKFIKSIIIARLEKRGYVVSKSASGNYTSETSKCRFRLAKYCSGYGVDLGFGGDPINDTAIRVDFQQPYANVGSYGVQLGGDARRLVWFRDSVLDYVYSSHLLEDFEDPRPVLEEWLRVLKLGGRLVLFCPDEQVYRAHCQCTGQPYNIEHKLADFSLDKIKSVLADIGMTKIIYEDRLVDDYSWDLVVEKVNHQYSETSAI